MSEILLETIDLKKYFYTPRGLLHAVDGINMQIKSGTTLGVVGESGCGKSTLGRVILRLLSATSGQVLFEGQNILDYDNKKMKNMRLMMQMIFQDPYASINPRMSVSEIISDPIRICKTINGKEAIAEKVRDLMKTVGLGDRYVNSYPHEMDGGRRQRVGIARALALEPRFIICDEPVSALDVSVQAQILNLLMDLQEERQLTYIFITHDLSVVKHISDEIMVMYLGQCVEKAPAQELFENPLHPYTEMLLSAIPIPSIETAQRERKKVRGEATNPINPEPGCRFAGRCPYSKAICLQNEIKQIEINPGHQVSCVNYYNE